MLETWSGIRRIAFGDPMGSAYWYPNYILRLVSVAQSPAQACSPSAQAAAAHVSRSRPKGFSASRMPMNPCSMFLFSLFLHSSKLSMMIHNDSEPSKAHLTSFLRTSRVSKLSSLFHVTLSQTWDGCLDQSHPGGPGMLSISIPTHFTYQTSNPSWFSYHCALWLSRKKDWSGFSFSLTVITNR